MYPWTVGKGTTWAIRASGMYSRGFLKNVRCPEKWEQPGNPCCEVWKRALILGMSIGRGHEQVYPLVPSNPLSSEISGFAREFPPCKARGTETDRNLPQCWNRCISSNTRVPWSLSSDGSLSGHTRSTKRTPNRCSARLIRRL